MFNCIFYHLICFEKDKNILYTYLLSFLTKSDDYLDLYVQYIWNLKNVFKSGGFWYTITT
jgi:hypothetical protein